MKYEADILSLTKVLDALDNNQLGIMGELIHETARRMKQIQDLHGEGTPPDATDNYVAVLMAAEFFATDKAKARKKEFRHIL